MRYDFGTVDTTCLSLDFSTLWWRRWGLLHELLADVVEELLGRAGSAGPVPGGGSITADAWMLVSDMVTEPYRDNAIGGPPCPLHAPHLPVSPESFLRNSGITST